MSKSFSSRRCTRSARFSTPRFSMTPLEAHLALIDEQIEAERRSSVDQRGSSQWRSQISWRVSPYSAN
jgi:hypothetical protein